MRVLVYGNRKEDNTYYNISTPEKRNASYLALFKHLDENWNLYDDLDEEVEEENVCEACFKNLCSYCHGRYNCYCENSTACSLRTRKQRSSKDEASWQRGWLKDARRGIAAAAIKLLQARQEYQYGSYQEANVIDPEEKK